MHAYKDAIRRTSGAYVLYPGEENREMRGFHEIIPGLGAFRIRPGHWIEDSSYLKQFLAEIKAHMLDRTSNREKLSYYEYNVHLKAKNDMLMERLPESEGENRDFMPDETTVILAYYKNEAHLEWILNNHLYNTRAGVRGGAIHITQELASARYIFLHNQKDKAYLCKLTKEGAMVYGYEEMKGKNYPFSQPVTEEDKKNTYLVFPINKNGLEKELRQYQWIPANIPALKGKHGMTIIPMKLTKLLSYAKHV